MAFYQPRKFERAGGCPGLTSLWAASGQHHIMYRKCMHDLQAALAGRVARKVLLSGPAGAGKSVALLGLTEWARASGW